MHGSVGAWRRAGTALLSVLVLIGLGAELVALGSLGRHLFKNILTGSNSEAGPAVIMAILIATGGLILLMAYIITIHRLSDSRERAHSLAVEQWINRWVDVIFGNTNLRKRHLPRSGREALIRLVGNLEGVEHVRASALLEAHGIVDVVLKQFTSRRLHRRLEAIELLSVARPSRAFSPLIEAIHDDRPEVRLRVARGAARILGTMPPGPGRDRHAATFARELEQAELSAGVLEEMLLLAEGAARIPVEMLLGARRSEVAVAAFNAGGRLKMRYLHERSLDATRHPDPEIRAAAFRFISRSGPAGPEGARLIQEGFDDPTSFVRVNAVRVSARASMEVVLPGLWKLLGDPSWWVRRAAAETLAEAGPVAQNKLLRAAHSHPDNFARDIAVQVVKDHGLDAIPPSEEVSV